MVRFLKISLFLTGICSLILEVAGQRLVNPFFGSSVFVWSAMITVTLVALSIGYAIGGRAVDKTPAVDLYLRLLMASAVAIAIIPLIRIKALVIAAPLGIRFGSLFGAGILLGPALVILGMLGPVAIRLITKEIETLGKSTGDAYAVSTLGSVFGAALTGFWLIPNFSLSQILWSTSALLLLLSIAGRVIKGDRTPRIASLFLILLFGLIFHGAKKTQGFLFSEETVYGRVEVMDSENQRFLFVNNTAQSAINIVTGEPSADYPYALQYSLKLNPKAKNALVLGLGSGMIPKSLIAKNISASSIEIDPTIEKVAREYFRLPETSLVEINDARVGLLNDSKSYDLIFLDAFGSETVPAHLFSKEAFGLMNEHLAHDGVLSINLVCSLNSPGDLAWKSIVSTLKSEFPFVRAFVVGDPKGHAPPNIAFFASNVPLVERELTFDSKKQREVISEMKKQELFLTEDGLLLTDDYSPLDSLLSPTMLSWRASVQSSMSKESFNE